MIDHMLLNKDKYMKLPSKVIIKPGAFMAYENANLNPANAMCFTVDEQLEAHVVGMTTGKYDTKTYLEYNVKPDLDHLYIVKTKSGQTLALTWVRVDENVIIE